VDIFYKNFVIIVVTVIILTVVIAIISTLSILPQKYANKLAAKNSLKEIMKAEAEWFQLDPDQNGIKDYWTYDVSCLHRMYLRDNETKVGLISIDLAKADVEAANIFETNVFVTPHKLKIRV